MSAQAFRFIHAADLHLEDPLVGLSEIPDHLRTQLVGAPLSAAQNVFDAAIDERADFVILSGDIIHPQLAGGHAISFLLEQFQKLAERDIVVYWVAGRSDAAEHWPAEFPFPENVVRFSHDAVESISHFRDDVLLATITGRSGAGKLRTSIADFQGDSGSGFQIAAACGDIDVDSLVHRNIDYWALGGNHQPTTLVSTPCLAEYPGTSQGRSIQDCGARGCLFVEIDHSGHVESRLIPTDVVRWQHEMLAAGDAHTMDQLQRQLRNRMQELQHDSSSRPTLVHWTIHSETYFPAHNSGLADELTNWLREQFGYGSSPVWSVRVDIQPPSSLPEDWYEEDTILGDFLRAVREVSSSSDSIELSRYAAERVRKSELSAVLKVSGPAAKARLLNEASVLGADLLRGELDLASQDSAHSRSAMEEIPT